MALKAKINCFTRSSAQAGYDQNRIVKEKKIYKYITMSHFIRFSSYF